MHYAAATLTILLAACTGPQPPTETPTTPAAEPAAQAPPEETPMAKRAPGEEGAPMAVFRAFGNEPFWNVNVEDATLTFTTPEDQVGVTMQGQRRQLDDGVEIAGLHDGKAFTLRVDAGTCSDGMSDNRYELTSRFRYGDTEYTGCAEVAK